MGLYTWIYNTDKLQAYEAKIDAVRHAPMSSGRAFAYRKLWQGLQANACMNPAAARLHRGLYYAVPATLAAGIVCAFALALPVAGAVAAVASLAGIAALMAAEMPVGFSPYGRLCNKAYGLLGAETGTRDYDSIPRLDALRRAHALAVQFRAYAHKGGERPQSSCAYAARLVLHKPQR